jgi:alanyl-tRNA synthetase
VTERLYYDDSYLRQFTARVTTCAPAGQHWHATLDRTAFYPASGGQPADAGTLGAANVLNVTEGANGEVVHVLDRAVAMGSVEGVIDWPRRRDHMQQHTGQHILSAAFVQHCLLPTVSFHLGREISTIDLPALPAPAQVEHAVREANAVVLANVAVEVMYGTAAELERLGIRKAVERQGVLRAVCIGDFDHQPCGGTHVTRSGEVGAIVVRRIEKQKQNARLEFLCGDRALAAAQLDYATLAEAARLLSCATGEIPSAVARFLAERQAGHKQLDAALQQLAEREAAELLREAGGAPCCVRKALSGADAAYVRRLATALCAGPGVQARIATRPGGFVVFAQSAGGPADMSRLLRDALGSVGGKGGGTRDFAQGSVPDPAQLETVLAMDPEQV